EKRVPKIVAHGRKMAAEVSAGKLRTEVSAKEDAARSAVDEAGHRVRSDATMKIELPDPEVSRSRRIATIGDGEREWVVQGPERIALIGRNGAGKTTLLERLVASGGEGAAEPHADAAHTSADAPSADGAPAWPVLRAISHTDRVGYLPQRV